MKRFIATLVCIICVQASIYWAIPSHSTEDTSTSYRENSDIRQPRYQTDPKQQNSGKRKTRYGPRKPPVTSISSSKETEFSNDSQQTDLLEKREAYFKRLDEIDAPSVEEITNLGELAFEANEAASAYDHYLDVIDNYSEHPLAPFALYKLAWTEFNLGDIDAAINDMELMLEWVDDGEVIMEQDLLNEGIADLQRFKSALN